MSVKSAMLAGLLAVAATPVFAHASLESGEGISLSTYYAGVRISHGCEGEPTLTVRVTIPEGVVGVKPELKAGWTIETVVGDYARAYEYHGTRTSGVKEIIWTGNSLPDDFYDVFRFRGYLSDALPVGETVYFPTVQECANGSHKWVEIPAEGQSRSDLKEPAPGLMITADPMAGHNH